MRLFTRNQAACIKQEYELKFQALTFADIKIDVIYFDKIGNNENELALYITYTFKKDLETAKVENEVPKSHSTELNDFFACYQPKEMPFSLDFPDCEMYQPK